MLFDCFGFFTSSLLQEWHAQQIASGEAKDNANFQPLGGDWYGNLNASISKWSNFSVFSFTSIFGLSFLSLSLSCIHSVRTFKPFLLQFNLHLACLHIGESE